MKAGAGGASTRAGEVRRGLLESLDAMLLRYSDALERHGIRRPY